MGHLELPLSLDDCFQQPLDLRDDGQTLPAGERVQALPTEVADMDYDPIRARRDIPVRIPAEIKQQSLPFASQLKQILSEIRQRLLAELFGWVNFAESVVGDVPTGRNTYWLE